ncbi:hypothetical protein BJ684DRAFT_19687 [Piptocephalis cylindrospora]|uniref:Uncharacterized protein n=1 Tax=Piptocephalis cylindrospora TaxID=1907219 RepID=A0A4V1IYA3_9FUNG|nr:hypothetical protein BJ684DRAFT_19687 [Piptocephalis cylindrospora]|eukprot:RKP13859.1 hypothetical protein BJ684DRAFT_19687 [Piptocephalis cylindrospora]
MENQLDGCIARLGEINNSLTHCTQKLSASTKGFDRLGRLLQLRKTHLLLTERELQQERERVGEEVSPLIYSMLAQAEDIVQTKKEERDAMEMRLGAPGEPSTPRSSRRADPPIPTTPVHGPGKHRLRALQRRREQLEGFLEGLDQEHEEVSAQLDRALMERKAAIEGEAERTTKRPRTSTTPDTRELIQEELEGLEEELRHRKERLQERRVQRTRKNPGMLSDMEGSMEGHVQEGGEKEGGMALQLSKQFFPSPKARHSEEDATDYGRWLRIYLEQNRILEETERSMLVRISPEDLSAWSESLVEEHKGMTSSIKEQTMSSPRTLKSLLRLFFPLRSLGSMMAEIILMISASPGKEVALSEVHTHVQKEGVDVQRLKPAMDMLVQLGLVEAEEDMSTSDIILRWRYGDPADPTPPASQPAYCSLVRTGMSPTHFFLLIVALLIGRLTSHWSLTRLTAFLAEDLLVHSHHKLYIFYSFAVLAVIYAVVCLGPLLHIVRTRVENLS